MKAAGATVARRSGYILGSNGAQPLWRVAPVSKTRTIPAAAVCHRTYAHGNNKNTLLPSIQRSTTCNSPSTDVFHSCFNALREQRRFTSASERLPEILHANNDEENVLRVAIMGPPNAGKSTLFNRLMDRSANQAYKLKVEKRRSKRRRRVNPVQKNVVRGGALVSAVPGTTRDVRQAVATLGPLERFILFDTAGVDGLRLKAWQQGVTRKKKRKKYAQNWNPVLDDDDDTANDYQRPMMEQAARAAQEASAILFVFDGRIGMTPDDMETCRWLRRHVFQNKPNEKGLRAQRVILLANKLEGDLLMNNEQYEEFLDEAAEAGFGPAIPISALHGEGMAELATELVDVSRELGMLRDVDDDSDDNEDDETSEEDKEPMKKQPRPLQVAILGRPNVGKSTLVNALLQERRVITGSRPGLTRDAIRVPWTWEGHSVQIVDTAGIRKPSQREDPQMSTPRKRRNKDKHINISEPLLEDMAVQDAVRALQLADVAVLVVDAEERMLLRQDLAIADLILQEGRVLVVVANKMDLVIDHDPKDPYTRKDLESGVRLQLEERFPYLRRTPIIPLDSKSGTNVAGDLMPVVLEAYRRWERKISTGQLNSWLAEVVDGHRPPSINGRATRIKYIVQTGGRPPTFLLFANCDSLPEPYMRYLARNFQETFDMYGMQIRLSIKKSTSSSGGNPFAHKARKRRGSGLGGREARRKRGLKKVIEARRRREKAQQL